MKCQTWLCYTCLVFIDFYMFLVLCKLIHSREVASLGKIAFFKTTWFSKGNMAVHATWRASGSLCWRLCWMSLGSCAERLLAHCEETGSTEIHPRSVVWVLWHPHSVSRRYWTSQASLQQICGRECGEDSSEHLSLVQVLIWTMSEECFSFHV